VRSLAAAVVVPWLVLSLGGCVGSGLSQRDEMMMAIEEFNDGIRWGSVDRSARHLPVEARKHFTDRYGAIEDEVEILDYEIQRIEVNRAAQSADVRVDISWTSKRSGILERTVVQQHWEQKGSSWVMTRQARLRGAPFTLLD
jgi:hypothetical protein